MFSCSFFFSNCAHNSKANGFGQKTSLNFGEDLFFFFFFWRSPDFWAEKLFEFPISAEKSLLISVKTFFFFWKSPEFGRKNRSISDFGPIFTLNFGKDSRIFEDLGPPPIKNPGYAYGRNDTSY